MTNQLIPGKMYLFKKSTLHPPLSGVKDFIAMFLGRRETHYEYKCLEQNGITNRISSWWDLTELK